MNKSELPFLRSSFIQRVFYLVLTSNNVFTHEIIVSIASLHCKICFQLLIMYLLIWTQRKKGAKPRTFGSDAKLNHWHFIIPKSEKYVKWYFYYTLVAHPLSFLIINKTDERRFIEQLVTNDENETYELSEASCDNQAIFTKDNTNLFSL